MTRRIYLASLILCAATLSRADEPANHDESLQKSVEAFQARYALTTLYESAVDDHGQGKPDLWGVRNFRAVLPGILYRAGANNSYRAAYGKPQLPNNGPLPEEGLTNLCQEGFSQAYYVYGASGFKPAPTQCERNGTTNVFNYSALHPQYSDHGRKTFLTAIRDRIVSGNHEPILVHCWNGYHASGVSSAIALRQFCGLSAEEAVTYWITTATPLEEKARERSLAQIRNFKPIESLSITAKQQQMVCFQGPIAGQHAVWRLPR
ncbi:hypothetical protein [Bradyrhizobium arachidis]|uniref:hypothetical protein n=1 Tax=Bradyrhizobium arachidis TaxID=858423 RepID=UPI0021624C8C|nr:hypothetical protein [Bradyrhizobium arachidis]UVO28140.1 hypothetical protein KUF59_37660 [Bradyrhizobium arachidis]